MLDVETRVEASEWKGMKERMNDINFFNYISNLLMYFLHFAGFLDHDDDGGSSLEEKFEIVVSF